MSAVDRGVDTARTLLRHSSVDVLDENRRTPLSWAAQLGQLPLIRLLLDHRADPKCRDNMGRSPLLWAATSKTALGAMETLLEDAPSLDVNEQDTAGRTALSLAAGAGNPHAVEWLLAQGAEAVRKDHSGRIPLSWAVQVGSRAVVELLTDNGVYPPAEDDTGRTLLSYAAEGGNVELFRDLLLQQRLHVDHADNSGRTPLSWLGGQSDTICRRLKRGSTPTQNDWIVDVFEVCKGGAGELVKVMLEHGADMESRDCEGRTPLSWAAAGGYSKVVKALLDYGADPNAVDRSGHTPLSYSVQSPIPEAVRYLLEASDQACYRDTTFRQRLLSQAASRGAGLAVIELARFWIHKGLPLTTGILEGSLSTLTVSMLCSDCYRLVKDAPFYACPACEVPEEDRFTLCLECAVQGGQCPEKHDLVRCRVNDTEDAPEAWWKDTDHGSSAR